MYVKIKYVDGFISYVCVKDNFSLAPVDKMLPEILTAEIFTDNGKRIGICKRKKTKEIYFRIFKKSNKPETLINQFFNFNIFYAAVI